MPEFLIKRTDVVSRAPSATNARGAGTRPAVAATARVVRKLRRVCVCDIGSPPFIAIRLSARV
jgi:hypothetical protein